ncbi:MAG: hypothetical protein JKY15_04910 [Deltaproteobacteria bacterium]|nr:hypothetical protein [Deltaproteobacteria bacterium]
MVERAANVLTSNVATSQAASYMGGEGLVSELAGNTAGSIVEKGLIRPIIAWTPPSIDDAKDVAKSTTQAGLSYYAAPALANGVTFLAGTTNPILILFIGLASSFTTSTVINYGLGYAFGGK